MERSINLSDLAQCAEEKIHIPGSIQPHGVLIAVKEIDWSIVQISQSATDAFGFAPKTLLDKPLAHLIGVSDQKRLAQMISTSNLVRVNPLLLSVKCQSGHKSFHAVVHRSEGLLVFELEESVSLTPLESVHFFRSTNESVTNILACHNTKELFDMIAQYVQKLTGFDRVMIYLFDREYNGTVVAESKVDQVASFLGFRFPESDIPAQARALYKRNSLRLLVDVDAAPSGIIPPDNPLTGQPLDLSEAVLRSMSPVHIEFLKNMGVRASMSLSLISNGELRGLIACHHESPGPVDYRVRQACDVLARLVSLRLDSLEERANYHRLCLLQAARKELLEDIFGQPDLPDAIANSSRLLEITDAKGAAIVWDDRCLLVGETPGQSQVVALMNELSKKMEGPIFSTDELAKCLPSAKNMEDFASGVLAVQLAAASPRWLVWFRPNVIHEVRWAGNPEMAAFTDSDMRIHPRKSFAQWEELVTGKSNPWFDCEIQNAVALRSELLEMILSLAEKKFATDLIGQVERLNALNDELGSLSQQLRSARDSALDASRRKSEMVSVVNHDLRAPLTSIKGSLDLLASSLFHLEPEAEELVKIAQGGTNYLLELIQSLLNLDTIENGNVEIHKTDLALNSLIEEAFQLVGSTAESSGIKLVSLVDTSVVSADRERILQVVLNLISNAIKFSPTGSQITVSSAQTDHGTIIKITDQGRGIPEKFRDLIFQRFQQIEDSDRTEKGGVGLGLPICKAFVEAHGGTIGVDSTVGSGSTFWFELPS